jgi:hypothetical protein
LPVAISEQIREFGVKEFADTHFSKTYTQGGFLFRRKVSVNQRSNFRFFEPPLIPYSSAFSLSGRAHDGVAEGQISMSVRPRKHLAF